VSDEDPAPAARHERHGDPC